MVEDSEDDAIIVERVLRKGGLSVSATRVSCAEEMDRALDEGPWDVILCDYLMPSFTVNDALALVRGRRLDTPFIIVSGAISDEIAVQMMKAGAHDYLNKDNLARLVPAVEREIVEAGERRQRREAELALVESEQRHRTLVESLTDTILVLNTQCQITEHYGPRVSSHSSSESLVERHLSEVLPTSVVDKISRLFDEVLSVEKGLAFQFPHDRDGVQVWSSVRLNPHEDGKRVVVVIGDVTEIKRAEEDARAAHGVALLYQDITGHDIRNAMQAILIATDLLATDDLDPSKQNLLDHIYDAVVECSDLIATVQGTANLLSTPLEKTSLSFTLRSCLELFSEDQKDVRIERRVSAKDAIVHADRFLSNLILNLLSNAVRHNSSDEKMVWVDLSEDQEGYIISVSDNGSGIPDDMKKNLLNPNRRSGGVGIHQCVQIASKYGGRLAIVDRVEGKPDMGARVDVWLPKIEYTQARSANSTYAKQEL